MATWHDIHMMARSEGYTCNSQYQDEMKMNAEIRKFVELNFTD